MIQYQKMKRFLCILFTAMFTLSAGAQGKQDVIASAGGYNVNGNLTISWTLGETIIPTFKSADNSLLLTHGFQQQLIITAIEENLESLVSIRVFPNPASDIINIRFEEPVDGEVNLLIINSQGKVVMTDVVESMILEKQISIRELPSGIYYFRIIHGKLSNVYKVVKL